MKKIIFITALVISCSSASAQILEKDLAPEEKIYGLSKFWSEAANTFPYFDLVPGINWDSVYRTCIPRALATRSIYEYALVLKKLCALLKDGHSGVLLPNPFFYDTLCSPPIVLRNFDHKAYVTFVPDSLKKIIPVGSEITRVDDVPVITYLQDNIIPYQCASTPQALWNQAIEDMLVDIFNTKVRVTFKTPDGRETTLTLLRNSRIYREREAIKGDALEFKWLKNDIAYILIKTFSDGRIINQFKKIFPELAKSKAIIIDIRENRGGNSGYATEILKYFTKNDSLTGVKVTSRQQVGAYKAWGRSNAGYKNFSDNKAILDLGIDQANNDKKDSAIIKPMVVLTGANTRSASENFLVTLDNIRTAVKMGATTNGSTGQPYFFPLTGGLRACVVSLKNTYPDGREFVGFGIKPDIEIKETIQDFISGKDVVLEKAIEYLLKK